MYEADSWYPHVCNYWNIAQRGIHSYLLITMTTAATLVLVEQIKPLWSNMLVDVSIVI